METQSISLVLGFPPSTNRYWRNLAGRTVLSKAGRLYKETVAMTVRKQLGMPVQAMTGPVAVHIDLCPPDRRRRDIDNHAGKGLLDALQAAGVYEDDSQIVELHAYMRDVEKGGRCAVEVMAL
jgi:crossover junction endodeoxyribonuclease RusA